MKKNKQTTTPEAQPATQCECVKLFCKNCRWSKPDRFMFLAQWEFAKCKRPVLKNELDPITGKIKRIDSYCSIERDNRFSILPDHCGLSGKFFNPK